jgi:hypothetical protein
MILPGTWCIASAQQPNPPAGFHAIFNGKDLTGYLAAIADPQHEQHEEMLEWRGSFDPEALDVKKATKEMRKVK